MQNYTKLKRDNMAISFEHAIYVHFTIKALQLLQLISMNTSSIWQHKYLKPS